MLNKERWERIENIYHDALQRAPEGRAVFLDQACDGDEEIRREVNSLLEFDGPAKGFIETPAMGIAARALAASRDMPAGTELTGDVGPYRLLGRIGQGGT